MLLRHIKELLKLVKLNVKDMAQCLIPYQYLFVQQDWHRRYHLWRQKQVQKRIIMPTGFYWMILRQQFTVNNRWRNEQERHNQPNICFSPDKLWTRYSGLNVLRSQFWELTPVMLQMKMKPEVDNEYTT